MAQDAQLLHAVGYALANGTDWPNWSEDSQFRAIRDRSAPARQPQPQAPQQPVPQQQQPPADTGERGERG